MDLTKVSPTEFEELVANIFRRLGFRTNMTKQTGDGGVDIEARYDGEIFKGTYLIQCKHWQKNVGEPPLRDLYGVVQDRNALKGILVTSSGFSPKAKEFTRGKNIDLIDGDTLAKLSEIEDLKEVTQQPVFSDEVAGFTEHLDFDRNLYKVLVKMINDNPKIEDSYLSLIELLLTSIWTMGYDSVHNGSLQEAIYYSQQYLERFALKKNNIARAKRTGVEYVLLMLHLLKGDYIQSYQYLCSLEHGHDFNERPNESNTFGRNKGLQEHIRKPVTDIYFFILDLLEIKSVSVEQYFNIGYLKYPTNFRYEGQLSAFHKAILIDWFEVDAGQIKERFRLEQVSDICEQKRVIESIYSGHLYGMKNILE